MKKFALILAATAAAAFSSTAASAAYVYAGSWNVADGPRWSGADAAGNAPPLSGVQTAAFLFGGTAADYVTSTIDNTVGSINFSSWVDGYEDSSHLIGGTAVADTFVGISGPNYRSGSGNYSAYVFDHACGIYYCAGGGGEKSTNFAFRIVGGAVPEPASWALMLTGFGLAGVAMRRRRVSKAQFA